MDWETASLGRPALRRPARATPWQNHEAPVDVGFFGGEPLICFDMLERVAEYARARAAEEGRGCASR
jgi:sulfatase maturation enzyme AslB (radical SAM superfamily)